MQQTTGVVTVVQEGRFRLVTPDGRSELFILAHGAPLEPQDLLSLVRDGSPVTVHHRPAEGRIAQLAHDITAPRNAPRSRDGTYSARRR